MSTSPAGSHDLFRFRFADIGEGLDEGEIVEWMVAVGDDVMRDQPLLSIETDKAVAELPSPIAGTVIELHGQPGDRVKVGEVLVTLQPSAAAVGSAPVPPVPPVTLVTLVTPVTPGPNRVRAAPAVRRHATELGVDLATVPGSGPDGRVTHSDVEAAHHEATVTTATRTSTTAQPATAHPATAQPTRSAPIGPSHAPTAGAPVRRTDGSIGHAEVGVHPLRGVRRRTAEAALRAWTTIPHISVTTEVDATALLAARDRLRADAAAESSRLTLVPFMVRAIAAAAARHPIVNATMADDGESYEVHAAVRVGVAVSTVDGLVVPVLSDGRGRGLIDLARELEDVVSRARNRGLSPADLSRGTITLTNYGAFGGTYAAPTIRAPEVAIVGMGEIAPRPLAVDGAVLVRPVLPLVLAADHRLIDGDVAGAFLKRIAHLLTDPVLLLAGG